MERLPLIGICTRPAESGDPNRAEVDIRYMNRVAEAGGVPVALKHGFDAAADASRILSRLDGLLLTGGGDLSPYSFGGNPYAKGCVAKLSFMSAERDVFEWAAALAAWDLDMPTLGICRGLQVMNVSFGGTLVRDISELPGHTLVHARYDCPDKPVHMVRVEGGSRLHDVLNLDELWVNSLHHLAIADVAKGARIPILASDGTPEGIEFPEKRFFMGVQWHPEILGNTPQLFEAFVEAARSYLEEKDS